MRGLAAALGLVLTVACQSPAGGTGSACTRASECATGTCELGRCRAGCHENRDCPSGATCLVGDDGMGGCSLEIDLGCESGVGRTCASGLVCVADRCERACDAPTDCPSDGECRAASSGGVRFCVDTRGEIDAGAGDAGDVDGGEVDASTACAIEQVCFQRMGAACARDCMGRVWCWGEQHGGALGNGMHADGRVTTPGLVVDDGGHALDAADSIACADGFACAHLGDAAARHGGHVLCWGTEPSGAFDSVPHVSATDLLAPIVASSAQVSASGSHVCVLDRTTHAVSCFGRNDGAIEPLMADGMLFPTPRAPAGGLPAASAVGVAAFGACVVLEGSGEVRCWGENEFGEAGHRPIESVAGAWDPNVPPTAVEVSAGMPLANVVQLAVGAESRAVLVRPAATGALVLRTWGRNATSELGERPAWTGEACDDQAGLGPVCRAFAESPTTTLAFASVASDGESRTSCGVEPSTHRVYCWGNNLFAHAGQPGGGLVWLATEAPVLVEGTQAPLDDVRDDGVFVGAANACAVRSDGSLWCWGPNQDAQLARPADAGEHLAVRIDFPFP